MLHLGLLDVAGWYGQGRLGPDGTDKGTYHSYLGFYEVELSRFVGRGCRLLELGVKCGYSLLMWREYLVDGEVHGVDVVERPGVLPDDVVFHQGSVRDVGFLCGLGEFDVVVDDATHEVEDQLCALGALWSRVREGGVYVVEDVKPECVGELLGFGGGELVDLRWGRPLTPDNLLAVFRK